MGNWLLSFQVKVHNMLVWVRIYVITFCVLKIFERADEVLHYDISKICFNGPDDVLKQTVNTQPAI